MSDASRDPARFGGGEGAAAAVQPLALQGTSLALNGTTWRHAVPSGITWRHSRRHGNPEPPKRPFDAPRAAPAPILLGNFPQASEPVAISVPRETPFTLAMAPQWCHTNAMDLTPYVDALRRELAVAAEAGGDDARELAERLTAPLESATRLTMLNVLSAAMDEITRELAPGSVDVRLRGLDPDFVVTPPPTDGGTHPEPAAPVEVPAPAPAEVDDGGTARVNLRLPAHLKARAEEAASREGLSVNAWLVRAVSAAVDGGRPRAPEKTRTTGQSFTGWVR